MLSTVLVIWGMLTAAVVFGQQQQWDQSPLEHAWSPPYYPSPLGGRRVQDDDKWRQSFERAREFVADLTLLEKVNVTSGIGWMQGKCVGNTGDLPRLNQPGLCLQDGPLGVRFADFITGFPAGITAGATFNKDLIYDRAAEIAKQHRGKGIDVMLGPSTGPVGTKALGGRIWEGFGADPYLQGIAGALSVEGIQDQGVVANAKHYIANEQEHFRQTEEWKGYNFTNLKGQVSSNVDDRALHEIYAWPFADMIHSNVGSIMCSYNKINNSLGCQNSYVLNKIAKDEMGFEGFMLSDWNAQQSGVASILAGLDMNMPGDSMGQGPAYMSSNLTTMVMNGTVPEWRLNDMAVRIMAAYYYVGVDVKREEIGETNFYSWSHNTTDALHAIDPENSPQGVVNEHINVETEESRDVAHRVALEGIVLLKNDNCTLPINPETQSIRQLSVLGLGAAASPQGPNCPTDQGCSEGVMASGWGSGAVDFPFLKIPLDEIARRAIDEGVNVNWNFETTPSEAYDKTATYSDVNVVFGLSDSGEGYLNVDGTMGDRNNASLWHNADQMIKRATELNSNNIVVITSPGPVNLERWIDHPNVTAVIFTTPGGQYTGQAIAEVLFGDHNPSGRLPFTIAKNDDDYVPLVREVPEDGLPQDNFDEGIFIDYRLFDKLEKTPRYEFGYGLSYSEWKFSNLQISQVKKPEKNLSPPESLGSGYEEIESNLPDPSECVFPEGFDRANPMFQYPWVNTTEELEPHGEYPYPDGYSTDQPTKYLPAGGGPGGHPQLFENVYKVKAQLTNKGPYDGGYVAQLYVGYPESSEYPSPPRQLRGFDKVDLSPGGSDTVEFDLRWKDLSVWDTNAQTWIIQPGTYKIYVGSSSRTCELAASINI
jgi:beta-glucosidase